MDITKMDSGLLVAHIQGQHEKDEDARKRALTEYRTKHALCPKCLNGEFEVRGGGMFYGSPTQEGYEDLSEATCHRCRWVGATHDRVPEGTLALYYDERDGELYSKAPIPSLNLRIRENGHYTICESADSQTAAWLASSFGGIIVWTNKEIPTERSSPAGVADFKVWLSREKQRATRFNQPTRLRELQIADHLAGEFLTGSAPTVSQGAELSQ